LHRQKGKKGIYVKRRREKERPLIKRGDYQKKNKMMHLEQRRRDRPFLEKECINAGWGKEGDSPGAEKAKEPKKGGAIRLGKAQALTGFQVRRGKASEPPTKKGKKSL